jgi:aminoacrylate hydrolase
MGQSAYEELGEALTIEACLPLHEFHPPRSPTNDPSVDIVAARIDALLAYDAGERLRQIRCPTLVVAAADDILVPRQLSKVLSREIAGARFAVLDSGGHHFPRTRAEAYSTLLSDFVRTAF